MIKKNLQDGRPSVSNINAKSAHLSEQNRNIQPVKKVVQQEQRCQQRDQEIQSLTIYYPRQERELDSLNQCNQKIQEELTNQLSINKDLQDRLDQYECKEKHNEQDGQVFDDILFQFKQERTNFDSQQRNLKEKYEKNYITPNKNLNVNNLLQKQTKNQRLSEQNENINPAAQPTSSIRRSTERESFNPFNRTKSVELRHGRLSRPALSLNDINQSSARQYTEYIDIKKSPSKVVIQDSVEPSYLIKQEYDYTQSMIGQIEQEINNLQQDMIHLDNKSAQNEQVVVKEGQAQQILNIKKRISSRMNKLEQLVKRALQLRRQIKTTQQ